MKLEVLSKPTVLAYTIGKNMPPETVAEFDSTKRTIGDVINVLSGNFFAVQQHFHYAFYFHLAPDFVTEILCYTDIKISRIDKDNNTDEGIMSGSVEQFLRAAVFFCTKRSDQLLRRLFNVICQTFEADNIVLPFIKTDLGDQTYVVKLH